MLFTHVTRTVLVDSLFVAQDLLFIMNVTEANCLIISFAICSRTYCTYYVLHAECTGMARCVDVSRMSNTVYCNV